MKVQAGDREVTVPGWVVGLAGLAATVVPVWTFLEARHDDRARRIVAEEDAPLLEEMRRSLDHLEERQQQADGFERCRSQMIGRGLPRSAVDSTCNLLFPPVRHDRAAHQPEEGR